MHALVLAEKGRAPEALKAIRAMLALGRDGVAAIDSEVTSVVVGASGLPSTADEAFALLEGPLGPLGVDALIDMTQMKSSPQLSKRASRSLSKPEVRAAASPATGVLLDMKAAKNCAAKKELLDRAKNEGDARMLTVLASMKEPRGCGFMGMRDCYPCLRKDTALDDAIAGIQARAAK
jgi:serine/threonine-protein kinase